MYVLHYLSNARNRNANSTLITRPVQRSKAPPVLMLPVEALVDLSSFEGSKTRLLYIPVP